LFDKVSQIITPLLVIIYYLRNFAPLSNVLGYKNEAYFSTEQNKKKK